MSTQLPPAFPDQPMDDEVILGTLAALRTLDVPTKGGRTTSYVYDSRNRLIQVDPPLVGDIQYSYDKVGNKLSETDENGHTRTFEYDALNRLKRIRRGITLERP